MDQTRSLADQFEANRPHLRAVAFRILGNSEEADDALQEAWLRLSTTDADDIENLSGWLTTVVSRICLNALRSRQRRPSESIDDADVDRISLSAAVTPEDQAILADSMGHALLVVLDRLNPAERISLALHDMFSVSFEEIGWVLGKSPEACRQLASRARRRVAIAEDQTSDPRRQRATWSMRSLPRPRPVTFEMFPHSSAPRRRARRPTQRRASPGPGPPDRTPTMSHCGSRVQGRGRPYKALLDGLARAGCWAQGGREGGFRFSRGGPAR